MDDDELEAAVTRAWPAILRFFASLHEETPPSVYSSADIRAARTKTVAVDTNAFPAGFNNLPRRARGRAAEQLAAHIARHHPDARRVLLLPEDHTRNPHYLHNVHHLMGILDAAGLEYVVGSADPDVVASVPGTADPEGHTLYYTLVICKDGRLYAGGGPVDLALSNNDFTSGVPKPLTECRTPIIPDPRLGWATRRKWKHFMLYNHIATHVARIAEVDAAALTVRTERHGPLDFKKREGLEELAQAVEKMLKRLQTDHAHLGIDTEPRVFIKDDTGTYGMGITVAASGDDVRHLNSRARQKMDKGKYGHKVQHVILQEGVPTEEHVEDAAAEPVIYMIGAEPIGGFMRLHPERGALENLNAPGMRFVPLASEAGPPDARARSDMARIMPHRVELAARIATAALAHEAAPAIMDAVEPDALPLPGLGVSRRAGS